MRHSLNPRRRTATAIIAGAILTSLAACAEDNESQGSDELTFTGSGGVTQEAMSNASVEPFAKEFGVKVTQDEPVDIAKLQVMVESGNVSWDVLHTSPYLVDQNCGTLFEPLDTDIIDLSGIPSPLVSECAAPIAMSAAVLLYNADTYQGDNVPTSWADFFDTDRFPGKRGIAKSAQYGQIEAALLADGVAPDELYPLDIERALDKLDSIRGDLVYFETGAQQQQQIESADVDMVIGWPGRVYGAVQNGADFEPVWDAALYFPDVLAVVKGAKHTENAMEYINFALSDQAQAAYADELPYAAVKTTVPPPTDPTIDKYAATQDKIEEYDVPALDTAWWSKNMEDMTTQWLDWVTQ